MTEAIKISRVWAMPSRWTFEIDPIKELLARYVGDGTGWVDPFAGENSPAEHTNDIEGRGAKTQLDGLEALMGFGYESINGVLFDPPYSVEMCLRKYTPKFNGTAGRTEYHTRCKDEIARIVRPGGKVISFGWNSSGIGLDRGFSPMEYMLVCHGAFHPDTIVTVERKTRTHICEVPRSGNSGGG